MLLARSKETLRSKEMVLKLSTVLRGNPNRHQSDYPY